MWELNFHNVGADPKGVTAHDIDLLAQYIDGDRLRRQRDEFSSR